MRPLLLLFLAGIIAAGCAACAPRDMSYLTRIVPRDRDLPAGCQALGPVKGEVHTGDIEEARYQAWREGERLGATHVRLGPVEWTFTAIECPPTHTVRGTAYRCPGP